MLGGEGIATKLVKSRYVLREGLSGGYYYWTKGLKDERYDDEDLKGLAVKGRAVLAMGGLLA